MASNEDIVVKKQISDLAESIREKYQALKLNDLNFQMYQEKKLKPLLKKIEGRDDADGLHPPHSFPCGSAQNFISPSFEVDDKVYGLKKVNGLWFLGSFPLRFTQSKIFLHDKTFPRSVGLVSLLSKKNPQNYSQFDLNNYRNMLTLTKAHLIHDGGNIKFRKGLKYEKIIRLIFPEFTATSKHTPEMTMMDHVMPLTTSTPLKHKSTIHASSVVGRSGDGGDDDDDAGDDKISASALLDRSINRLQNMQSVLQDKHQISDDSRTLQIQNRSLPHHSLSKDGLGLHAALDRKKVIKPNQKEASYQLIQLLQANREIQAFHEMTRYFVE